MRCSSDYEDAQCPANPNAEEELMHQVQEQLKGTKRRRNLRHRSSVLQSNRKATDYDDEDAFFG